MLVRKRIYDNLFILNYSHNKNDDDLYDKDNNDADSLMIRVLYAQIYDYLQ